MINYICDTAKECGSETCNYRLSLPEHARLMPQLGFMCVKAGHRVYPELVAPTCCAMESHTCYYCNHEGTDVNRIAGWNVVCRGSTEYCCDDGIMCDERWQALEEKKEAEDLEGEIRRAIIGEQGETFGLVSWASLADRAAARIMKLIELPF